MRTRTAGLIRAGASDPCCCVVPCCLPFSLPSSVTVTIPVGSTSDLNLGRCDIADVIDYANQGTLTHTGTTATASLTYDDTSVSGSCRTGLAEYETSEVISSSFVGKRVLTNEDVTAEWENTIKVKVVLELSVGPPCVSQIRVSLSGPCSTSNTLNGSNVTAYQLDTRQVNTRWLWVTSWLRNGTDGLVSGGTYDITAGSTGQTVTVQL